MTDRYSEYRRVPGNDAEIGELSDCTKTLENITSSDKLESAHSPEAMRSPTTSAQSKLGPSFPTAHRPQWGPKELGMVFTCGAVAGALLVAVLLGPPVGRNPADMAPLLTNVLVPAAAADHRHQPSDASPSGQKPRRVLFVGNSFTYGPPSYDEPANTLYNLPAMVRVIAESLNQV